MCSFRCDDKKFREHAKIGMLERNPISLCSQMLLCATQVLIACIIALKMTYREFDEDKAAGFRFALNASFKPLCISDMPCAEHLHTRN